MKTLSSHTHVFALAILVICNDFSFGQNPLEMPTEPLEKNNGIVSLMETLKGRMRDNDERANEILQKYFNRGGQDEEPFFYNPFTCMRDNNEHAKELTRKLAGHGSPEVVQFLFDNITWRPSP